LYLQSRYSGYFGAGSLAWSGLKPVSPDLSVPSS
jgi:hypothetical protein